MPRLTDDLQVHTLPTGAFGFSAQRLEDLGASQYTLVTIAVDDSTSVESFRREMTVCLKHSITACKSSPRADSLMVRLIKFNREWKERHGFKLLENINLDDYDHLLGEGGTTALYDAAENAIQATAKYGKELTEKDYDVNGLIFVITDGMNVGSKATLASVKNAMLQTKREEALESLKIILVGVNVTDPEVSKALTLFKDEVGIDQYEELNNADAKTLARLSGFISKSVSSSSQAIGTGGPSKNIAF